QMPCRSALVPLGSGCQLPALLVFRIVPPPPTAQTASGAAAHTPSSEAEPLQSVANAPPVECRMIDWPTIQTSFGPVPPTASSGAEVPLDRDEKPVAVGIDARSGGPRSIGPRTTRSGGGGARS